MDETPADLGGKDNTWRRLTLTALPRHSALASLVGCLEEGERVSLGRLKTALTAQHSQQPTKPLSSLRYNIFIVLTSTLGFICIYMSSYTYVHRNYVLDMLFFLASLFLV